MAAWPRNVVKEHRCAAWLLYLFLISLYITYASYTINHNLQRRDHPLVVEDVVEFVDEVELLVVVDEVELELLVVVVVKQPGS